MDRIEQLIKRHPELLASLKKRIPMYHSSNVFFRDVQFGLQAVLASEGVRLSNRKAEQLARSFASHLEREKIFRPVDQQTWVLQYPDFRTPKVEKAAAAAPAAR